MKPVQDVKIIWRSEEWLSGDTDVLVLPDELSRQNVLVPEASMRREKLKDQPVGSTPLLKKEASLVYSGIAVPMGNAWFPVWVAENPNLLPG